MSFQFIDVRHFELSFPIIKAVEWQHRFSDEDEDVDSSYEDFRFYPEWKDDYHKAYQFLELVRKLGLFDHCSFVFELRIDKLNGIGFRKVLESKLKECICDKIKGMYGYIWDGDKPELDFIFSDIEVIFE